MDVWVERLLIRRSSWLQGKRNHTRRALQRFYPILDKIASTLADHELQTPEEPYTIWLVQYMEVATMT